MTPSILIPRVASAFKSLCMTVIHRPHPNECSGGDLDGDLYFISWDENLIPPNIVAPMDYTGRRPRIMDHEVTLQVTSTGKT